MTDPDIRNRLLLLESPRRSGLRWCRGVRAPLSFSPLRGYYTGFLRLLGDSWAQAVRLYRERQERESRAGEDVNLAVRRQWASSCNDYRPTTDGGHVKSVHKVPISVDTRATTHVSSPCSVR